MHNYLNLNLGLVNVDSFDTLPQRDQFLLRQAVTDCEFKLLTLAG